MKQISVKSQKLLALVSTAIVVILARVYSSFFYPNSQRGHAGETESITIGIQSLESSAPVYIAEDKGFFARNGLNVTIKYYDTGIAAVNGMLNDEADMAASAEFALVSKAFKKEKIHTIGSLDKVEYGYLIGRKDRGSLVSK